MQTKETGYFAGFPYLIISINDCGLSVPSRKIAVAPNVIPDKNRELSEFSQI